MSGTSEGMRSSTLGKSKEKVGKMFGTKTGVSSGKRDGLEREGKTPVRNTWSKKLVNGFTLEGWTLTERKIILN